ncbi:MAG: ComEC/Rec2 family competence protein, partial [Terriglobales bacterium]
MLWWLAAAVIFLAAAAYCARRRPRLAALLALATLAALGALSLECRDAAGSPFGPAARFTDGREALISAHVTQDAASRQSPWGGPRQVVDVETEQVEVSGVAEPVRMGLRLTMYAPAPSEEEEADAEREEPALPGLLYGQRLRFPARLRLPRNFGNPGAFDSRGYLAGQGIVALASERSDKVEMLPGFSGSRLAPWRSAARRTLLERMRELWSREDAALLAAMLLGERAALERGSRLNFQRTGTYHILVVSGLHVGILAFVVFWVMRRLRASEILATVATLALAAAYAWLSGHGLPAQRATLMLAIYLGARLLYRERAPLNAIGAAALLLLLMDPRALFDASFQLTFVAVLAIAGLALPLLERTSLPYRRALRNLDSAEYDVSLAPRRAQFRLDLRLVAGRMARWLPLRAAQGLLVGMARALLAAYDVLLVAALMQVALALPMAVYFHRATLLALPANAIIMPLAGILLPAAMLAAALAQVSLALAKIPALVAAAALHGITSTVELLSALRAAEVRVPTPGLAVALAAAAAFVLALLTARRHWRWAAAGLALLPASALLLAWVAP